MNNQIFKTANRIVLKIGSNLICDAHDGAVKQGCIDNIVRNALQQFDNKEIIIVTSGAIALGRAGMGIDFTKPSRAIMLAQKQAAAALGQRPLIEAYNKAFNDFGRQIAPILLSPHDTEDRKAHLNARATLNALLKAGHVPLINENDTVATEEIRFGDNDRLAARVAQMVEADLLILLSTVDGLYTANPDQDEAAEHIPVVKNIDETLQSYAQDSSAGFSTGGMRSKLMAAQMCVGTGIPLLILDGRTAAPFSSYADCTARGTLFEGTAGPAISARKKWIGAHIAPKGLLTIDDGAARALQNGKSLLPAGILACEGAFDYGDPVTVQGANGEKLATGLSNYDCQAVCTIRGRQSAEIVTLLGYERSDCVIHRDNMVLH